MDVNKKEKLELENGQKSWFMGRRVVGWHIAIFHKMVDLFLLVTTGALLCHSVLQLSLIKISSLKFPLRRRDHINATATRWFLP